MCNEPNQELTNKPQTNVRAKKPRKITPQTNTLTNTQAGMVLDFQKIEQKQWRLAVEKP